MFFCLLRPGGAVGAVALSMAVSLSAPAFAAPFVLTHNGGEAQLTINGAAHNELIH